MGERGPDAVGGRPEARGMEEKEVCPRIFTDWHGLKSVGLG